MEVMLGDHMCMESLRKDITDLQGTVIDVFSRVGAVRIPSWKFPDKMSCDLDLVQLLDRYDYVEDDPEFTQVSHMVLLELVIDRMLLLLQSFDIYTDLIRNEGHYNPAHGPGPSMSIGLTVRKYWSNMVKLGRLFTKSGLCEKMVSTQDALVSKGIEGVKEPAYLSSSRPQTASSHPQSCALSSRLQESKLGMTKNTCTVGSQTLESALVPCDACAIAQSSLKEVSDAIVSVCRSQNLPSSLTKVQDVLPTGGILSPNEMRYWASEESKDLARISKHLSELTQLIQPLRNQLQDAKTENEKLQQNIDGLNNQLQAKQEEILRCRKDSERKLHEKGQQSQELMDKLERDKEELRKGSAVLEERVSILKEELKMQHCTIRDLGKLFATKDYIEGLLPENCGHINKPELARQRLLSDVQSMVHKEEVSVMEKKVNVLKDNLEDALQKLRKAEEAVSKQKAHGQSLQTQKESLQAKQRSLLQQLDRLSKECEDLRVNLEDAEEENAKLEMQIEGMKKEEETLKGQLRDQQEMVMVLQKERETLEKSVSEVTRQLTELQGCLQEQKERERLLVSYPDLNPVPEFECSGDITEDMERQLQANSIRITILEEENAKLRASLQKLEEKSKQRPLQIVPQVQLWTLSSGTERISLDPQPAHSSSSLSKPTSPKVSSTLTKDSESSSSIGQPRRISSRQAVNLVTFPPENSPIAAFAHVKQVKSRNRTPITDHK